jgi:oligopeptide transport system ATP-binding protein
VSSILAVEDLETSFFTEEGVVRAVDRVSFTIREGETLALVGESGSGKSVTSLSILRLVPEPAGRIVGGKVIFEGRDLLALPKKEMERLRGDRIAMVFQDPMTSLNPFLSIERQLSEVLETHCGASRAEARKEAERALARVGIPDPKARLDHYPHQLSGGMRQRVMIAMALLARPKLLIADEPTTALDVTIQAQILELIRSLKDELGMSVLLISHDLGVVAGMADRVAVMYAGKIVEEGPSEAIFSKPQHPYTTGLLASIPRLRGEKKELVPIGGAPPDLLRLPKGCAFFPRCSRAIDRCSKEIPSLEGADHRAACFVPPMI